MLKYRKSLLAGIAAVPLTYHVLIGWAPATAAVEAEVPTDAKKVSVSPDREAYFGDLHLHTTNSFDAYIMMGTKTTPDEAYKFARGDTISYLGQPIRRGVPLDFLAVTDHSENIGVFNQLDEPNSAFSLSEIGKLAREGGAANFLKIVDILANGGSLGEEAKAVSASTWQRNIETANRNYQPGKFTTFIAYEWTSMPGGQNLHRNVIFRGGTAPIPFTSADSRDPEQLWTWLSQIRTKGYEALAIPHNGNASNGLMYDWVSLSGKPIDEGYAQLRAANEPLSEVSQNKGSSETHPALSPNDEFSNFEIFDHLLISPSPSKPGGSYWRDALGRGLVLGAKLGTNPYKDGAVGASDLHSGLSVSSQQEYGSISAPNIGPGKPKTRQEAARAIGLEGLAGAVPIKPQEVTAGNLTGVWAESNTREAIYDAFRRKETFATSGSRLKVRFFAGWNFAPSLLAKSGWVHDAYRTGVPMGSDLSGVQPGKTPSFVVQAVKDSNGGNLDRVQVVKVWLEGGHQHERVFDVAWAGKRRIDPRTGKLPAIGDTVDARKGTYTNSIGAAQLSTVWRDPSFRADQSAVYYVRVLEIPTPRWTTLRAAEFGLPLPQGVPASVQQRAWTSPIWYTAAPMGHTR